MREHGLARSLGFAWSQASFREPGDGRKRVTEAALDVGTADLAEYFGSIGIIKIDKKTRKPKIWLYRDKVTGELKGDGTVTYDDPFSAASAVQWFGNKEWKGAQPTAYSGRIWGARDWSFCVVVLVVLPGGGDQGVGTHVSAPRGSARLLGMLS